MKWKFLILILCIGLFAGAVFIALKTERKQYSDGSDSVVEYTVSDEETEKDVNRETYNELVRLHEKYKDVYAWVEVPGTKIDYPILQHESDDAFYLHHDMDGDENRYGSIYTESINSKDFKDPNTVIYGHNMRDESMFGTLKWFEDRDFFNQNTDIVITTLSDIRIYRIMAVYRFSDDHLLKNQEILTESGIKEYLNKIPDYVNKAGGFLREDIERKEPIITLSSCATGDTSYRLLVQAVLLKVEKV